VRFNRLQRQHGRKIISNNNVLTETGRALDGAAIIKYLDISIHVGIIVMEFEWDDNKNAENIRKHEGISFEDAVLVFYDNWNIEDIDASHSDDEEQRFTIIGMSEFQLLRVTLPCERMLKDKMLSELSRRGEQSITK